MNKSNLINDVAKITCLSKKDSGNAIDAVIDAIKSGVKKGPVRLIGFGTFSLVKRKSRKGRNPQTGEKITIKAKNVVKFKPSKSLNK